MMASGRHPAAVDAGCSVALQEQTGGYRGTLMWQRGSRATEVGGGASAVGAGVWRVRTMANLGDGMVGSRLAMSVAAMPVSSKVATTAPARRCWQRSC